VTPDGAIQIVHPHAEPVDVPILSSFEFWPDWLFYGPVALHWIALAVRYGAASLPTAANPHIALGGLCGESKQAILAQVQGEARDLLARSTTTFVRGDMSCDAREAEAAMAVAGLDYPLVVKPDIGCNGTGVRLAASRACLLRYLALFPRGERVLLQEYVPHTGEAGLFYVRHPDRPKGRVTSITLKYPPFVIGDGRSTLGQLIKADPRAGRVAFLYLERLNHRLNEVPAQGQPVRLVFVGNHCKGSIFRDGSSLATAALNERVELLARALPDFYFGRIDVRFTSLAALCQGEGFRVIEINGVGSEATHIWDPRTRLWDAWRAQFFHYGEAFRIGAANRARGHKPAGIRAMWRHWRRQKRLMAAYPMND
jgi:hypothetical protein